MSSLTDSQIEACSNVQDDGTIEIDAYFLMKMVEKDEQDKREKDLMSQLGFVSDDGKKDEKKDEKKKGLLLNESIMANTGLTKDETKILWEKTSYFSVALRKRFPDEFYMTKLDEISELTKRHQLLVIDSLKQQRGVGKTAEVAEIDKVVEEWIEEAAAGVAGQKDDEKKDEENLCPRCIEDHDDEHGERVSGSKVVSSCEGCGVCENCEHLMECKEVEEEKIRKHTIEVDEFRKYSIKQGNVMMSMIEKQLDAMKTDDEKIDDLTPEEANIFLKKSNAFINDWQKIYDEEMKDQTKQFQAALIVSLKAKRCRDIDDVEIDASLKKTFGPRGSMDESSDESSDDSDAKKVGPDMRNCVYIKLVGKSMWHTEIQVGQYDHNELFNIYKLVVPRMTKEFPYEVTFGGLRSVGMHAIWGDKYNGVASAIYGGDLCDDVIVLDGDDEADDCGSVAKMEAIAKGLKDFIDADNKEHA